MKIYLMAFIALLIMSGCQNPATEEKTLIIEKDTTPIEVVIDAEPDAAKNAVIAAVEMAHQRTASLAKQAIQFDIQLLFGGKERLKGKLTFSTDSERGRIDLENGKQIYYNGNEVHYSPSFESDKSIRFDAYTWGYFFLFPYKLSDAGTNWDIYENKKLGEKSYQTQKLTFDAGTGDDPNDWYIMYADEESNLIQCAAYIVTAGGSTQEEAEKDPHAIEYTNYIEVDGIPFAQNWKFWGWQPAEGLTDQLGEATITNIQFVDLEADFFTAPADFLKK